MPRSDGQAKPVASGFLRPWPTLVALILVFCNGCAFDQRVQKKTIGEFGRFSFHAADGRKAGFAVGVPHGGTEADAIEYAQAISAATGAGLVIASGFQANRIPVAQPLIDQTPISWNAYSPRPGSVYPEFRDFLRSALDGPLKFYVGVRIADDPQPAAVIEVASAGFSFEQIEALKTSYFTVRDHQILDSTVPRIAVALNPLDGISWNAFGVKNHGVLMLAEKGLILRLPKVLALPHVKAVYREIIAEWVDKAFGLARDFSFAGADVRIRSLSLGRIDAITRQGDLRGVVIAAPHGSFDWYTSELVEELSYRSSVAGVVARGFTPTECGGWRINVNRPSERRYPTDTIERASARSREVYEAFREVVFDAARGPLNLYAEIHQNGSERNIDVATLGVSREQARVIKSLYGRIRDRVLADTPQITKVELLIEPVDEVSIGAWAAKDQGVLRLAKNSFHFELPAHSVFYGENTRRAYTQILAELISSIIRMETAAAK